MRALAVLAVVIFHIDPTWLPGGFVGVDLFFVISGYLISSIVLKDLQQQRFSYRSFYARRVRRIFPALILVLLSSLIAGWLILFPDEFRAMGKHAAGATLFIPNIMSWKESGYFDEIAELKPLLHLWSLGVEEQFYLLWPPALLLAYRRGWSLPKVVIALATLSFAINLAWVGEHAAATFFMPHTRFWELLAGVWLAVRTPRTLAPRQAMLTSLLGMALLVAAFIALDGSQPYPGWRALLPVLAAVLLIAAGPQAPVNRLLAWRPLVAIGLISYPLYLWHWPLFAYARLLGHSDNLTLSVLAVVALLLAWATYALLERPLRFRFSKQAQRRAVGWCCAGLLLASGISFTAYKGDGLAQWRGFDSTRYADLGDFRIARERFNACAQKPASLDWCFVARADAPADTVLLGDSHADHLFPGLATSDKRRNWMLLGRSACPPLLSAYTVRKDLPPGCKDSMQAAVDMLATQPQVKHVLLAMIMPYYITETGYAPQHLTPEANPQELKLVSALPDEASLSEDEIFARGLERMVSALEAQGKQVTIAIDVPEVPYMPITCFTRHVGLDHRKVEHPGCDVPEAIALERQERSRAILAALQKNHPKLRIFDPLPALCEQGSCIVGTPDTLYYRDSHHLSYRGSVKVAEALVEWLDSGKQR